MTPTKLLPNIIVVLAAVVGLVATPILLMPPQAPQPKSAGKDKKIGKGKANPRVVSAPEPPYDPEKLPAGERGCGRPDAKNNTPCECMRHRLKARQEATEECMKLGDRAARMACFVQIPACAKVVDAESNTPNENGEWMPTQCSRSCRLAKCLCCNS